MKNKTMKKTLMALSMATLFGVSSMALAGTVPTNGVSTHTTNVSLSVLPSCQISTGDGLDFGTINDVFTTYAYNMMPVDVTCNNNGTPYIIDVANADPTDGHIELTATDTSNVAWLYVQSPGGTTVIKNDASGSDVYSSTYTDTGPQETDFTFTIVNQDLTMGDDSEPLQQGSYTGVINWELHF